MHWSESNRSRVAPNIGPAGLDRAVGRPAHRLEQRRDRQLRDRISLRRLRGPALADRRQPGNPWVRRWVWPTPSPDAHPMHRRLHPSANLPLATEVGPTAGQRFHPARSPRSPWVGRWVQPTPSPGTHPLHRRLHPPVSEVRRPAQSPPDRTPSGARTSHGTAVPTMGRSAALMSSPVSVVARLRPPRLLAYLSRSARSTRSSAASATAAMVDPTETVTRTCAGPRWIQEFSTSIRTRSAVAARPGWSIPGGRITNS